MNSSDWEADQDVLSATKNVLKSITDDANVSEACNVSKRQQHESEEYSLGFVSSGSIMFRSIVEQLNSTFSQCSLRNCDLRELRCHSLVYEIEESGDIEGFVNDELLRNLRSIELVSLTNASLFESSSSIPVICF